MIAFDRVARQLVGGDVLLIVPPFAAANRPQLGVHLLQALARKQGVTAEVLYSNLLFASMVGEDNYLLICETDHRNSLLGERLFAGAAYALPPLGRDAGTQVRSLFRDHSRELNFDVYRGFADLVPTWTKLVIELVRKGGYRAVGLTSSFEQINASVALIKAIRHACPELVIVIGGANCQGEMAAGTLDLCPEVDLVFEGESEETFVEFVETLKEATLGWRPPQSVVKGRPCDNLDGLPAPSYTDYYNQLHRALPLSRMQIQRNLFFAFETSRGCWWGQKHHCTFCGLNGEDIGYRAKSPERSLAELKLLAAEHLNRTGCDRVFMVDNIMPFHFFSSFIPMLTEANLDLNIFYEQKANLSLARVRALARAGVRRIQPGIEALSSALLKQIDKGVTASQNIALLRYARAVGLLLDWNLLAGLPMDEEEMYRETLGLVPLLRHLPPPNRLGRLRIDRFSPYFVRPSAYGIKNLRPLPVYSAVLPEGANISRIAYHFEGDFDTVAVRSPELIEALEVEVNTWRAAWEEQQAPSLEVKALGIERFELVDERGLAGTETCIMLGRAEAASLLVARPWNQVHATIREWALATRLAVRRDEMLVPLATATPNLLEMFEAEVHASAARQEEAPSQVRSGFGGAD